jgi:hypothetical protein
MIKNRMIQTDIGMPEKLRQSAVLDMYRYQPIHRISNYRFDDAISFDNPDFVEISIDSYRNRYGVAEGDPAFEQIESGWTPPLRGSRRWLVFNYSRAEVSY